LHYKIFENGFLGVDVFFVISGYLITPKIKSIFDSKHSIFAKYKLIFKFYLNRIFRLVPALGVTILFSSILMILLGQPSDTKRFVSQSIYSLVGIANLGSYKNSGNYFNPDSNPLLHTWSLSVEAQYYLMTPLIFIFWYYLKNKLKLNYGYLYPWFSIFSISLIFFLNQHIELSFINYFFPKVNSSFLYYSIFSRLWELILGGFAAEYGTKFMGSAMFRNEKLRKYNLISFAILLAWTSVFLFGNNQFKIVLITFSTAFVLTRKYKAIDQLKTISWFGDRSYSLYLTHYPLNYFIEKIIIFKAIQINQLIYLLIYIITLLVAANLLYKLVEKKYLQSNREFSALYKLLSKFFIVPLVFSSLLYSQNIYVQRTFFIHPNIPYYGGHRIDPADGFMDVWCKGNKQIEDYCFFNSNNTVKTVALLGDSHAEQYFKTLSKISTKMNFKLVSMTLPGCRFSILNNSKSKFSDKCIDFNLKSLEKLKVMKPDAVILSQAIYPGEEIALLIDGITKLKLLDLNLIIVGNNPVFPDSNNYMVARPFLFGDYKAPRYFNKKNMDSGIFYISKQLLTNIKDKNVLIVDPVPFFCELDVCSRWKNGEWLYYDNSHLSVYGSDLLFPEFERILKLYLI